MSTGPTLHTSVLIRCIAFSLAIIPAAIYAQPAPQSASKLAEDTAMAQQKIRREILLEAFAVWKETYCLEDGSVDRSDNGKYGYAMREIDDLMRTARKMGMPQLAIDLLDELPDDLVSRYHSEAYKSLIEKHAKEGRTDEALKLSLHPPAVLKEKLDCGYLVKRIVRRLASQGRVDKAIEVAKSFQPATQIQPDGTYTRDQQTRYSIDRAIALAMIVDDFEQGRDYAKRTFPEVGFESLGLRVIDLCGRDIGKALAVARQLPKHEYQFIAVRKVFFRYALGGYDVEDNGKAPPDLKACQQIIDYAIATDREEFIDYFIGQHPYGDSLLSERRIPDAVKLLLKKEVVSFTDEEFAELDIKRQAPLIGALFHFGHVEQAIRWENQNEEKRADLREDKENLYGHDYLSFMVNRVEELVEQGELDAAKKLADAIAHGKRRNYLRGVLVRAMYDRAARKQDNEATTRVNELASAYYRKTREPHWGTIVHSGDENLLQDLLQSYRDKKWDRDYLLSELARIDFLAESRMGAAVHFAGISNKIERGLDVIRSLKELRGLPFALDALISLELSDEQMQKVLNEIHEDLAFQAEPSQWIEFFELLNEHNIKLKFSLWPDRRDKYIEKANEQQLLRMIELTPHSRYVNRALARFHIRNGNVEQFIKLTREEIDFAVVTKARLHFTDDYFRSISQLDIEKLDAITDLANSIEHDETKTKFIKQLILLYSIAGHIERARKLANADSPRLRCEWLLLISKHAFRGSN